MRWVIVYLLAIMALSAAACKADLAVVVSPVCTNPSDQISPDIYGNNIVWEDYRDEATNAADIWRHDLSLSQEFPLVQAPGNQWLPAIWGLNVVFQNDPDPDSPGILFDIWRSVIGGSASAISLAPQNEWSPAISGNRVAWERDNGNGNWDIISYDLGTSTEKPVASSLSAEQYASTGGDYTVYSKLNGIDYDLYSYQHSTSATTLIAGGVGDQFMASTNGKRVVWEDWRSTTPGQAPDIYMYNLQTHTQTPICTASGQQLNPVIWGSYVVWWDKRTGTPQVRMYDLNTGLEQAVSPPGQRASFPRIYQNRVVWQVWNGTNNDIYMAQIGPTYQDFPTVGAVREQPDGTGVSITGKVVTRDFGDFFAIAEIDRSSGILVKGQWTLTPGTIVAVKGILKSTDSGERIIEPSDVTPGLIGNPGNEPVELRLSNGAVSGSDLGVNTPGVTNGVGLNNVGNFVATWGKVLESGADWFYITDGTSLSDGTGTYGGLRVECPGITPPTPSQTTRYLVKGISGLYKPSPLSSRFPLLKVAKPADIQELTTP